MTDLILALDCSLRLTNVAVSSGGGVLVSERLDIGRRQAGELPLIVERVLSDAGFAFRDIGLLAVTNGPGYFTGIRVGVSYAAALAYGLGVRVVPVSTLHMLAYSHTLRLTPVLAVVYAGQKRVYAASFGCICDLPAGEYGEDAIGDWLSHHEDVAIISDDPQKIFDVPGPVQRILPDAAVVARIARCSGEMAVSPLALKVFYHRNPG